MQKIKIRQMRIHKRHFQLLELMVAMFILLICIAPTMRIFTTMYQSQQEIIRENQRDHLAHWVHADIVERLYKKEIQFEKDEKSKIIPLSDQVIEELKKFGYEVEGTLAIEYKQPKDKDKSPNKYLGKLIIKLRDVSLKGQAKTDRAESSYDFYVYIDSGALHKGEDEEEEEIAQIPLTEQKKGPTSTSSLDDDEDEDDEDDEDEDEDDFFDDDDDEDDEDEDDEDDF